MMKVRIKIVSSNGTLPRYETKGSAGMDLRALLGEPIVLNPGERCLVPTGIYIELRRLQAQIRAKADWL